LTSIFDAILLAVCSTLTLGILFFSYLTKDEVTKVQPNYQHTSFRVMN